MEERWKNERSVLCARSADRLRARETRAFSAQRGVCPQHAARSGRTGELRGDGADVRRQERFRAPERSCGGVRTGRPCRRARPSYRRRDGRAHALARSGRTGFRGAHGDLVCRGNGMAVFLLRALRLCKKKRNWTPIPDLRRRTGSSSPSTAQSRNSAIPRRR